MPSSHLPLTREARTWCEARDSAKQTERSFKGKGVGDFRGIIVFFAIVVRMAVFGATGGASKARMP